LAIDPLSLKHACAGVGTIISAVQGGPDTIIDGQSRLLEAALAAGDRRTAARIPGEYAAATGKELHRVRRGNVTTQPGVASDE
jgi:hypothetical protein